MSPKRESNTKVSTTPSRGLLQKIFGSSPMTPEMEQGLSIAQQEDPNLAPVKPYGFFSRMFSPSSMGYTSPGKTIYLNPTMMEGQTPQEVADTILHEQTHVNQMTNRGLNSVGELMREFGDMRTPYYQRPDELEAYQNEFERRRRMGRMQTAIPSFSTGEFHVPSDIYLPQERGVKIGPTSSKLKAAGR